MMVGLGQTDPRVVAIRTQLEGQRRLELQKLREDYQSRAVALRSNFNAQMRAIIQKYRSMLGEGAAL